MSYNSDRKLQVDAIITFILLKRLLTPIDKTDAYKKGYVDRKGVSISDHNNKKISLLDKIIFKLKRLLGGRISTLNKFVYVKSLGDDFATRLIPQAGVGNRGEVKRLIRDLEKINEKYGMSGLDEMFETVLHEEMHNMTDYNGYIKENYFKI